MNILGFIFIVSVLLMVEDCYGLESTVRNALDEAYKTNRQNVNMQREQVFMSKMWPEISSLIPDVVKLPKFKGNFGMNDIIYATGNICPKVNDIFNMHFESDCVIEKRTCIYAIINANLHLPNPVSFEIYKEDASGKKSKQVYASYKFKSQNTVTFRLKIPDFSQARDKISTECVIYIDAFAIEDLSEPTVDESKLKNAEAKAMANKYWNSVKNSDISIMMRIGIMKALLDKLYPDTSRALKDSTKSEEKWVCLSNQFMNRVLRDVSSHSDDEISGGKDGKEKKAKYRRTDNEEIIYEKINSAEYIKSIQLGIDRSINIFSSQPIRDVLMVDFMDTEHKTFTPDMQEMGPDPKPVFDFVTYAPVVFKHLRKSFGITEANFVNTFCQVPLIELSNPGKSGSGLYLSQNKYFIAKTVKKVEAEFLQGILPGYLLNLYQNPDTLLPKFFGLYWYEHWMITNLRLLVMNNLMPSQINIHRKYDLKGSKYEREVSDKEKDNPSTTFKDLDFLHHHPQGIYLKPNDHKRLMKTIQRDCMVLQSCQIIDYSLLLGIHYIDGLKEKGNAHLVDEMSLPCVSLVDEKASFTASGNFAQGGIPAVTASGEKLKLYVGIIDILQSYRLRKRFEHYWKSISLFGKEFSVVDPTHYAHRFEDFMGESVFKKMPKCQTDKSTDTQKSFKLGELMKVHDEKRKEH